MYRCADADERSEQKSKIKGISHSSGIRNSVAPVVVLPSAGLSPRAAEIMERVGLLCTERR